jgi:hypothetical protein
MGKSEVYSWRVSPETKTSLEHEAHRQGISLGSLLERITADWLEARRSENGSDSAEQRRLQMKAARLFGSIAGGDPERSARSRDIVRRRLAQRSSRTAGSNRRSSSLERSEAESRNNVGRKA